MFSPVRLAAAVREPANRGILLSLAAVFNGASLLVMFLLGVIAGMIAHASLMKKK